MAAPSFVFCVSGDYVKTIYFSIIPYTPGMGDSGNFGLQILFICSTLRVDLHGSIFVA